MKDEKIIRKLKLIKARVGLLNAVIDSLVEEAESLDQDWNKEYIFDYLHNGYPESAEEALEYAKKRKR